MTRRTALWLATCIHCGKATLSVDETIEHDKHCEPLHPEGCLVSNATYHGGCRCFGCTRAHAVYELAQYHRRRAMAAKRAMR